jgi:hypothetical protein
VLFTSNAILTLLLSEPLIVIVDQLLRFRFHMKSSCGMFGL